jgi:hypothetical protein
MFFDPEMRIYGTKLSAVWSYQNKQKNAGQDKVFHNKKHDINLIINS